MLQKTTTDTKARLLALIDGASPDLRAKINEWLVLLADEGVPVLIYEIYRSNEQQNLNYAQGRTVPGNIITYARGGRSKHNQTLNGKPASRAFDACPMINNSPSWSKKGDAKIAWEKMGKAAFKVGLYWGRNFTNMSGDWTHFEIK